MEEDSQNQNLEIIRYNNLLDNEEDKELKKVLSILILSGALIITYLYCKYKLTYWKRRGVQQLPSTHIIFGDFLNAILFRTAPGYHLGEIYRKASQDAPYVGFYIFHKPCLLLRDPEIIKQILIQDFNNFSDRHFAGSQQKDSIGMVNLFGLKNPAWKYLRRKISSTLTRRKLKQMLSLMMETGRPMMNFLSEKCNNGSNVIDVQDVNYRFTADIIANIALGTTTDSFGNPTSDYTKSLFEFFHGFKRMVALVTVFFMPELVQVVGTRMLFDSSFVRQLFWAAVESRERDGNERGDFIDSIIKLKNGEQNELYKFEGDNLLYQSGTFFSGFESSSTAAAFTLMELAKNKQYQQQAREDIKTAIGRHGWTMDAFSEMKFLNQCISEGIRMHPSISTIDRYTLQDYKIPGTDIVLEKGTPIFISLYGLHGDHRFFAEPDTYDPSRFSCDRRISPAYIPFGVGSRQCIGIKAGLLHVKVVLSMILSEYEIYQKPGEINKLDSRSTFTAAAKGINIEFRKIVR